MKKILVIITLFFLFSNTSFANEEILIKNNNIQSRIDNIGTKILNSKFWNLTARSVSRAKTTISVWKKRLPLTPLPPVSQSNVP